MTTTRSVTCLLAAVLALAGFNYAAAQTDEFGAPIAKPPAPVAAAAPSAGCIPEDQIPPANTDNVLCKTFLGDPVSRRQEAAFLYLLKNTDEETFIRGFNLGEGGGDEFSSTGGGQSEAEKNTGALAWAHRVLDGTQDIPVTLRLMMYRYNPDNKSFFTTASTPTLNLDLGYGGFSIGPIQSGNLEGIIIHHWDQFGSIVMMPAYAKDYITALSVAGSNRVAVLFAHVRLRPASKRNLQNNASRTQFDADIRDYKLGSVDDVLSEKYTRFMTAVPYARTAAENEFGKQTDHKAFISPNELVMFLADGTLFSGPVYNMQIQTKVQALANATMGYWYVTNGTVILSYPVPGSRSNTEKSFVIEGDTLRLNGIPYVLDPHLQLNGSKINYR